LRVGRPQEYHTPPSAHALHYGQPPQHGAGLAQTFTPHHYSHGQLNTSVESVPSTAYSSPRMMPSNNHFDTSSLSSSSRESSVYSATPSSSANTVRAAAASSSRSTRAKRGSESQGSGRDRKRPSMPSNGGPQSDDEFMSWCYTCNKHFGECSTPKEHERKSRKIVKEKASRGRQAAALQDAEDTLEYFCDLSPLKEQMPGNQKKSGLSYDKQQVIEAELVLLDIAIRTLASQLDPEAFAEFKAKADRIIRDQVAAKGGEGPIEGVLLVSGSGDQPCVHELRRMNCDTPIACRKERHAANCRINLARIFEAGTAATTPHIPETPAAAATLPVRPSRPVSTPRRRHDPNSHL
jgi:hypothetical protein